MSLGDFDLIVTCEKCSTSFQLDEARLPMSGARVRCSKCKHAFFLANPSASQTEAVHAVAEEAASAPDGQVPPALADLNASTLHGLAELPGAEPVPEPDLEEEEWQFSEEIRVEGDDERDDEFGDAPSHGPSAGSDSDSDFGENEDFGAGLDEPAMVTEASDSELEIASPEDPELANPAESDSHAVSMQEQKQELELAAASEPSETPRDESSFGSVDDFSELMEDEEPGVAVDLASEIASELEQEAALEAHAGLEPEEASSDDLGDPEGWDLVGTDNFAADRSSLGGIRGSFVGKQALGPVEVSDFFSDDGLGGTAYDDDLASSSMFAGPLAQIGRIAGWAISIALVSSVLFLALQSEWAHWAQAPQRVSRGPLQAETISSGWVQSSRSGPILRFEGQIRNTGGEAIWPGVIQLALLDAAGERLSVPSIQAGAPIAERILREAAPDILAVHTTGALRRLGGPPLAPGEVRTFEALVLEDQLPKQARRVLLEVGESRRGALRATPRILALPEAESAADEEGATEESTADVSEASGQSPTPAQLEVESVLSP